MDIPTRPQPHPHGGWPGNELEEVLAASLGVPAAGGRIVEVLGRSHLWVPLPSGGSQQSATLDLPAMEIEGQAYVPVFSSEQQLRQAVGDHMSFTVAPAVEFARGLPPQLGIAVNPDGTVGIPLPPAAVAELCRGRRSELDGPVSGGRVQLFAPDWQDDPVDFLSAASAEFEATGVVSSARRCLARIEDGGPVLFIGVELLPHAQAAREEPLDALGRALGRVPVDWPVNIVLLDIAQDPVADWMRDKVRPFYRRDH
ncbi:enhanced serine sensitivity protein SseB [Streptomyces sp. NA04227]|uniref:enhanced serine sensitivity protein SseB n=1 Tax=Streptomyces sp. NA04227 TaxID=2742136 RepID=UPI001590BEF1|nr:enhanced serine sensitivity protein SseB [Streptomyces sp. NA04227]QKW09320.1 enhanced serine sensitivity protein SseB [Streptomyces sp. NA04227]